MKTVPVNYKGSVAGYALVDDWHYDNLTRFTWHLHHGHARRRDYASKSNVYMHDEVKLCLPQCDHVNRNQLDNREENLRSATHAQNQCNRGKRIGSANFYKGVSAARGRYQARLVINGKRVSLGCFDTAELAAEAYNRSAKLHYGEFACLNEIVSTSTVLEKLLEGSPFSDGHIRPSSPT